MMKMRSLIGLFLVSFLLMGASNSYATSQYYAGFLQFSAVTPDAACSLYFDSRVAINSGYSSYTINTVGADATTYGRCNTFFNGNADISVTITIYDAACPAGYVDDGNDQCILIPSNPCEATAGQVAQSGLFQEPYQHSGCFNGCLAYVSSCSAEHTVIVDGIDTIFNACTYNYSTAATQCTSGTPTDVAVLPSPSCTASQTIGSLNGETICINNSSGQVDTTQAPTNTSQNEQKQVATVDNGDGTSTTIITTTTTNNFGDTTTVTETTIINNSSGDVVSSGKQTDSVELPRDEEEEQEQCGGNNQPVCEVSLDGDGELADPSTTISTSGILDTLTNFEADLLTIENETTEFFTLPSFNLYSGGGCNPDAFGTTFKGEPFKLLEEYCPIHEAYVRPAFNWAFYMLTLFGLYSIFIKTFRKT